MGEIGLEPDVFWDMSPKEFWATAHGYRKRVERETRDLYDAARIVGRAALAPHTKKRIKLSDVARMPWDIKDTDKVQGKYISYEQGSALMNLIARKN